MLERGNSCPSPPSSVRSLRGDKTSDGNGVGKYSGAGIKCQGGRWRFARPLITYSLEFDRGGGVSIRESADFESERRAKGNGKGIVVNVKKKRCECFFFAKKKFEKK